MSSVTFILLVFGAAVFLVSMAVAYLTGYVAEDLRPRDHEYEPTRPIRFPPPPHAAEDFVRYCVSQRVLSRDVPRIHTTEPTRIGSIRIYLN